jgi:hypothetical protein
MSSETESDIVGSEVLTAVLVKGLDFTPLYLRKQNSSKPDKDMNALHHIKTISKSCVTPLRSITSSGCDLLTRINISDLYRLTLRDLH